MFNRKNENQEHYWNLSCNPSLVRNKQIIQFGKEIIQSEHKQHKIVQYGTTHGSPIRRKQNSNDPIRKNKSQNTKHKINNKKTKTNEMITQKT